MSELLVKSLHAAASNEAALQKTKAFLADESKLLEFADKIEKGEQRDRFLSISGIDGDIYDNLRTILNKRDIGDATKIVARQGRRGGLYLTTQEEVVGPQVDRASEEALEKESEQVDNRELTLEREYYPLVKAWAEVAGFASTAITGGLLPGYRWENPDLIAVDYVVAKFDKAIAFDIVSFEVKLRIDPYAVWQAAHYKRFSSQVYVAFAKGEDEIREQNDGRVFELAVELGLGVLAYDSNKRKFAEIQTPRIEVPNNVRTNETVERFLRIEVVKEVVEKAILERSLGR